MKVLDSVFKVLIVVGISLSLYLQYKQHLVNQEVSESILMFNYQNLVNSAIGMHTNRLVLGLYENEVEGLVIEQLIIDRENLIRSAKQEDLYLNK